MDGWPKIHTRPNPTAAELRATLAAMTPAPWWAGSNNRRKTGIGLVGVGEGEDAAPVAVLAGARWTIRARGANSVGIAMLRNAAGDLLAALEAVDRIRAQIGDCAGHRHLPLEVERCPWCIIRGLLDGAP